MRVHPVCVGMYHMCASCFGGCMYHVCASCGGLVSCMCTLCGDYSLLLAGSLSDFLLGFSVMVWRFGSESSKAGWRFLFNKWFF